MESIATVAIAMHNVKIFLENTEFTMATMGLLKLKTPEIVAKQLARALVEKIGKRRSYHSHHEYELVDFLLASTVESK